MPKAKILVVEDDPDINELIRSRLEANDYEVDGALNGAEALEMAKENPPDLILLDIVMPGMDGFDTGTKLKENDNTKDIPVIMVTARAQHKDVLRALSEVGAVDYVIKPFKSDILLKKVEDALKDKGK